MASKVLPRGTSCRIAARDAKSVHVADSHSRSFAGENARQGSAKRDGRGTECLATGCSLCSVRLSQPSLVLFTPGVPDSM